MAKADLVNVLFVSRESGEEEFTFRYFCIDRSGRIHRIKEALFEVAILVRDDPSLELDSYLTQYLECGLNTVPTLFCSPGGEWNEAVKCFEFGIDDCLLRPYSRGELGARVRALLRRRELYRRM